MTLRWSRLLIPAAILLGSGVAMQRDRHVDRSVPVSLLPARAVVPGVDVRAEGVSVSRRDDGHAVAEGAMEAGGGAVGDAMRRALAAVVAEPDPDRQADAAVELVAGIDAGALASWVEGLAGGMLAGAVPGLRDGLVRRWAGEQPVAAAFWAERQPDRAIRREVMTQVALGWAEHDVQAAIEWATGLAGDEARSGMLRDLGYEAARTDPVEALRVASMLAPGGDRDNLVVHAVSQWAEADALAATEWACAIPGLALRQRVLAAVATAMADQDPEVAVTLATQAMWPGVEQDQAAVAIVQRWTQQDPSGSASWVQRFSEGDLKENALRSLIAVCSP